MYSRTGVHQNGCPVCWAASSASKVEEALAEVLGATLSPQLPIKWTNGKMYAVDMIMPDFLTVVEYDGWWWHQDTKDRDIFKTANLIEAGYKVIRVRENNLHLLPNQEGLYQLSFFPRKDSVNNLAEAIKDLVKKNRNEHVEQ